MAPILNNRQRVPAAHSSRRPRVSAQPSDVQLAMASLFGRGVELLNPVYQRLVNECKDAAAAAATTQPPEVPDIILHCEYTRQVEELHRRYGNRTGRVYAFGRDDSAQLGQPAHGELEEGQKKQYYGPLSVHMKLPDNTIVTKNIRQIAVGGQHTIALTDNGAPLTWGSSDKGVLGRPVLEDQEGDVTASESTATAVTHFVTVDGVDEAGTIAQIAAGLTFSMFLSISGNVYVCGYYKDDDTEYKMTSSSDESPFGFNQFPVHVPLPGKVVAIYAGSESKISLAELEDGRLMTWGMGLSGQLARSRTMMGSPGPDGKFDLSKDWYTSVDENGEKVVDVEKVKKYLTPDFVLFNYPTDKMKVLHAVSGTSHSLIVLRPHGGKGESLVFVAGSNTTGQLGLETSEDDPYCHELTMIPKLKGKNIVKVAAGEFHSLALDITGTHVFGWGATDKAQLGQGFDFTRQLICHEPRLIKFPQVEWTTAPVQRMFRDIKAGGAASMAITTENEVFTWGISENGATGHTDVPEGQDVYWAREFKVADAIAASATTSGVKMEVMDAGVGSQHSVVLVQEKSRKRDCPDN